jgi:hypothetical protein
MRQVPRFPVEPPVSTFRVRLLGGRNAPPNCKEIWRDVEVGANQFVAQLGDAIPLAFGIENACPWCFILHGPVVDSTAEYYFAPPSQPRSWLTDGNAYDAGRVRLRDLPLPGATGRREFHLRLNDGSWLFGVKLIAASPMAESHLRYPRVVAVHGADPPQGPGERGADRQPTIPSLAVNAPHQASHLGM